MLTEFDGEPVAGGTLPAQIWREFIARATKANEDGGLRLTAVSRLHAGLRREARRRVEPRQRLLPRRAQPRLLLRRAARPDGRLQAERGVRPARRRPERGRRQGTALRPAARGGVRLRPGRPGRRPGVVVAQDPRGGGLSAGDSVRLSVTKSRYGLIPNFVGSSLETAGAGGAAAEARSARHEQAGADGHDSPAEPRARSRDRARPRHQARGRGRLTKGELLTE